MRPPADDDGLDGLAGCHILPIPAAPSTGEGKYIRADVIFTKKLEGAVCRWLAFVNEGIQALLPCCHSLCRLPVDATPARGNRMRPSAYLPPDRCMLFTAMAGVPDFSAMIRSCSSMTARAASSPSSPPRTSLGTLRLDRCEPSS